MKKSIGFLLVMGMLGGGGEVGAQQDVAPDLVANDAIAGQAISVERAGVGADVFLKWFDDDGIDFKLLGNDNSNPSSYIGLGDFEKIVNGVADPTKLAQFTWVISKHPEGRKLMSAVPKEVLKAKLGMLMTYDGTNRSNQERSRVAGTFCYWQCLVNNFGFVDFGGGYGDSDVRRMKHLIENITMEENAVFDGYGGKTELSFLYTTLSLYDRKDTSTNWARVVRISQNTEGVPVGRVSAEILTSLVQGKIGASLVAYTIKRVANGKTIDARVIEPYLNAVASTPFGLLALNKVVPAKEAIKLVGYFAQNQDKIKLTPNLRASFVKILVEKGLTAKDLKLKVKPKDYRSIIGLVDKTNNNSKDEVAEVAKLIFKDNKSTSLERRQGIWEITLASWDHPHGVLNWNTEANAPHQLYLFNMLTEEDGKEILRRNKDKIKPIVSKIQPKNREEEEAKIRVLKVIDEPPSTKTSSEKEKK